MEFNSGFKGLRWFVSPSHRSPLPSQEISLALIYVTG